MQIAGTMKGSWVIPDMNCHRVIWGGLLLAICGPSSELSRKAHLNLSSPHLLTGISITPTYENEEIFAYGCNDLPMFFMYCYKLQLSNHNDLQ